MSSFACLVILAILAANVHDSIGPPPTTNSDIYGSSARTAATKSPFVESIDLLLEARENAVPDLAGLFLPSNRMSLEVQPALHGVRRRHVFKALPLQFD